MDNLLLPILVVVFLIFVISIGLERTMQILPALIIFGLLFWFFGWIIINFFWVIIIFWIIRKLSIPEKARKNTRYYRTYNNKEAEEFFREYFRQNRGYSQNTSGQNYGYEQNYGQHRTYNWEENRDKYYKELGVDKNVTKEELRKAYLRKVKENHPDRFTNASEQEKKYHEDKLKKINEAYDNLNKDFS